MAQLYFNSPIRLHFVVLNYAQGLSQYLRSLGRWGHGFESQSGHGSLVCACVFPWLGSGLETG
jgi:hypothetical protein